ncbi:MAG: hypothetical protein ACPGR2_16055 [Psychrobium sp.]
MDRMLRFLLMVLIIALAITCYQIGFATGTYALVALGLVLEVAFWIGIFKKPKKVTS